MFVNEKFYQTEVENENVFVRIDDDCCTDRLLYLDTAQSKEVVIADDEYANDEFMSEL